jgi:hypothetical protein
MINAENTMTPAIPKKRKLLASLPYLIVAAITIHSWYDFYNHRYLPSAVHYVTGVLVAINGVLLAWRFKLGLLVTGGILVFAAFGLLFFLTIRSSFLTLFGITIPFEGWSFLLFILYTAINFDLLINWYLDTKGIKPLDRDE